MKFTLAVGTATLALALPALGQTAAAPAGVVATAVPASPLAPDAGATSWNAGPYTYDPSGNIIGIAGGDGQQTFRYDVNGRLVTSTITGPLGSTTEQFGYDVYANMLTHTVDGSTTSFPTTSATNHLTSGINAAYDAAGNMTQWQPPGTAVVYRYSYDALHMMTESKATDTSNNAYAGAHRVMHVYTADDERIWTYDLTAQVSQWRLRGLDGKVLRDFAVDSTWHLTRDYVYRDGALLAAITPAGSEHYTLDHLGTPRLITDGSGNRIGAIRTYRPFGQEWTTASPVAGASVLQFTGHERDADAVGANGLDYMHARFYEGPIGRFLSMDPIGGGVSTPQTWNRYSYVENNPLSRTDPTGMISWCGASGCTVIVHEFTDDFLFELSDRQYAQERGEFLRESFQFVSGAVNAFGSDFLLGRFRQERNDSAYQSGQELGDSAALLLSYAEVQGGLGGGAAAFVANMTGVGALAGVPALAVSGAAVVHGSLVATIAGSHLVASKGDRFRGTESKRAGDDAFFRVCREFGIDPRGKDGRRLHDEITRQGFGYDEIYETALGFGWQPL